MNKNQTQQYSQLSVVIPAYEPSWELTRLVDHLTHVGFGHIIIVDDGSSSSHQKLFQTLQNHDSVHILYHNINQGKGVALKTGLRYVYEYLVQCSGVITADADGQHLPEDIQKVANALSQTPDHFVLGIRHFDNNVPARSKLGNKISRLLFRWYHGQDIKDTQTGLRGFPYSLLPKLLTIEHTGYEYEMQCLTKLIENNYPCLQVTIQTVYKDNNMSSHFHPLWDSVRIYIVFFRYVLVAAISFAIDWTLFSILYLLSQQLLLSLVLARICSASFNFYQNKYRVHLAGSSDLFGQELAQYIILSATILGAAYVSIHLLNYYTQLSVILIKMAVDLALFVVNFLVQRYVIFKTKCYKLP